MSAGVGKKRLRSLVFMRARKFLEAIIEDKVTERFQAAQLASWNLLTRNRQFVRTNLKLELIYAIGVFLRYGVLMPIRFALFTIALVLLVSVSLIIGSLPSKR